MYLQCLNVLIAKSVPFGMFGVLRPFHDELCAFCHTGFVSSIDFKVIMT